MIGRPFLSLGILLGSLIIFLGFRGIEIPEHIAANIANRRIAFATVHNEDIVVHGASDYLEGLSAFRQGDYARAIELLHQARRGELLSRWILAQSEDRLGNLKEALGNLDPRIPVECRLYGTILFAHLPKFSPTEQAQWRAGLRRDCPYLLVSYAQTLFDDGDYAATLMWANSFPEREDSLTVQLLIGQSHFYLGEYSEAETILQATYQKFPSEHSTSYWYGAALLSINKPESAIPLLEKAAEIVRVVPSPTTEAWYEGTLAKAYMRAGRCIEANAAINRAWTLDNSRYNVARIETLRVALSNTCPLQ